MTPVKTVYVLYFLGYFTGVTAVFGVIYAYRVRGRDDMADSHLTYLIEAFWITIVGVMLGLALLFLTLGKVIVLVMLLWSMARLTSGLVRALTARPINMVRYFRAWAV